MLLLNGRSREVLRSERRVWLLPTRARSRVKKTKGETISWEGVDRDLFEKLRELRARLAKERGVPAYVIFGDTSLRAMARDRPRTREEFLEVHGVGQKKLADFGDVFLEAIGNPVGGAD